MVVWSIAGMCYHGRKLNCPRQRESNQVRKNISPAWYRCTTAPLQRYRRMVARVLWCGSVAFFPDIVGCVFRKYVAEMFDCGVHWLWNAGNTNGSKFSKICGGNVRFRGALTVKCRQYEWVEIVEILWLKRALFTAFADSINFFVFLVFVLKFLLMKWGWFWVELICMYSSVSCVVDREKC